MKRVQPLEADMGALSIWAVLLFGGAILLAGMPAQALNAGQAHLQGRKPAYASRPSPSRWHAYRRDSEGPGGFNKLSKHLSSKKPCALAISSCKVERESMGFALPLPGAEKRIKQERRRGSHRFREHLCMRSCAQQ